MRSWEWLGIGLFCTVMLFMFLHIDQQFNDLCVPPMPVDGTQTELDAWSERAGKPLTRIDLICLQNEIYEPGIYFFFSASWFCFIMSWIAGRKKKQHDGAQ